MRSKNNLVLVCVVLSLALVACSGSNKRVPAKLEAITNAYELNRSWSLNVGTSAPFSFSPVAVAGDIYTVSRVGEIYRVNASSGKVQWSVRTEAEISSGVGTDGRQVAVVSSKGMVMTFDAATGKKLWETSVGNEVLTEPMVSRGTIVVRTIDNRFVAIDGATGKRIWVTQKPQSALSLRSSYAMLNLEGEGFLTGISGGRYGVMRFADGSTLLEGILGIPKGVSEIERLADITAIPTIQGSRVCMVAYQGKIGCGDIRQQQLTWTKEFSSHTGLTQSTDKVFSSSSKSFMTAFSADTGQQLWMNEKLLWRELGEPLAAGKFVIAGDVEGYLHFFSQEDGQIMGRVRVDSSPITSAPLAVGGLIIVQTKGGTLAGYSPK
ncbi:MAG: outer membrane protein assembly factor BamB [Betaproteobacteria bacterium]